MAAYYTAFVDNENGEDRESWSIFYTPCFVDPTEAGARALAQAHLDALLASPDGQDGMYDDYIIVLQPSSN